MKTFEDLEFNDMDSFPYNEWARVYFDNGWGVSVVRGPHTYGGENGLYELAVLKDGHLHYENEMAKGDVVGWLRPEDVTDAMKLIQEFK
jgi:hypothetical protein